MPPCWAEFHWLFHRQAHNPPTTLIHCTAKANNHRGSQPQWWILIHLKVRHQDLHLALEMHLENTKHWNTMILCHLVALVVKMIYDKCWWCWRWWSGKGSLEWYFTFICSTHCHIPPPEDSSWRHGCKRQQGKSAVSEQHTIPCSIFLIIGWICLLSFFATHDQHHKMKKRLSSNYCILFDKGSHPRVCNIGRGPWPILHFFHCS